MPYPSLFSALLGRVARPTRRAAAGLLLAGGLAGRPALAQTAQPVQPAQAAPAAALLAQAGYYRLRIGAATITALSDGTLLLPMRQLLIDAPPAEVDRLLTQAGLPAELVETSVNIYLIELGSRVLLIDTGCGALLGPTAGHLLPSLRAAGFRPEQVTDILLTHLHADHFGGLLTDGQRTFPNATVHLSRTEADYEADLAQAPAGAKSFVRGGQAALAPYAAAGKVATFTGTQQLLPGFQAVPGPGHTPGHSFYVLASQGQQLVFWGDLVHATSVELPKPAASFRFDTSRPQTAASRRQAYPEAARQGYLVAINHASFPGIGYVRAVGQGYE